MAKSKTEDLPESDRVEGFSHPREIFALIGQDAALARAAEAIRSGRPPSAWLLTGPPGIGKATLAYRMARYLLRHGATNQGAADLALDENDPVAKLVAAQSHPGLLVITRRSNEKTGKMSSVLSVDEIRRLGAFFGLTESGGGWRVAIIDCADDMNEAAANALLKILEEPPPRSILLVVAHAPGRLLPTIRSRCRRLDVQPLPPATLADALEKFLPDTGSDDRAVLAQWAEGSLGQALRLSGGDGLDFAREAQMLLDVKGTPDIAALLALGDRVARAADGIDHFGTFLGQVLAKRIRERAAVGGKNLDRWVDQWQASADRFARASGLHLEPRQTVLATALALAGAKRRNGPL